MAERDLAVAVITRALLDLREAVRKRGKLISGRVHMRWPGDYRSSAAAHFLLDETGEMAFSRRVWSEAAAYDPAYIKRKAQEMIDETVRGKVLGRDKLGIRMLKERKK